MKRHIMLLAFALGLSGCASQAVPWGPETGGLVCRLHTINEQREIAITIRNQGNTSVELPTWNKDVPRLKISLLEEPAVRSPAKFGGALESSRTLKPGEAYTFRLLDGYLLFYGIPNKIGWTRFQPTDRAYHVKVSVETPAGPLESNVFETQLIGLR
jgi:hypothetical protein